MPKISKRLLEAVREDINNALAEVAQKHGLTFVEGFKIGYTEDEFKISGAQFISGGLLDYERSEFERYCESYLINKECYLETIFYEGKEYEFIGFDPSKRKFPYKFRQKDSGKTIFFTASAVEKFRDNFIGKWKLTEVPLPSLRD